MNARRWTQRPPALATPIPALLALALLALAPCGGCVAFYSHRHVTFRVVDGDSGAPLPRATVSVSYEPHLFVFNKPRNRSVKTSRRGAVTLPVAKWWLHSGPGFSFAAPGYLDYVESARPGERLPRGLLPCDDGTPRRPCFVIPLYRGPAPVVTFVVPDDYTGPVALDLIPSPRPTPAEPGRRDIDLHVPATGYVALEATPLLRRTWPVRYRARRPDGTPIPPASVHEPDDHALWTVRTDGDRRLFVVGTKVLHDCVEDQVFLRHVNAAGVVITSPDPSPVRAFIDRLRDGAAPQAAD